MRRLAYLTAALMTLTLAACSVGPGSARSGSAVPSMAAAARVLLTLPRNSYDVLTGRRIAPGMLGVAANGCMTVGGAYLQVGYGSAITDDGRGAAISGVGVYRVGQMLPALYGYAKTVTNESMPKDLERCGPGRYVTSPYALARETDRASTLVTGRVVGGDPSTAGGRLDAGGNGCVRAGGRYLLAPPGSSLTDAGRMVMLNGVGTYRVGSWMPTLTARTVFYTTAQLPPEVRRCGPGPYTVVDAVQLQPVLVFDPVNDSTRMVVRPASPGAAPASTVAGDTLSKSNTCVTVGGAFLAAPHGSTVFADGRQIHLTGIGDFRLGARLPTLPGSIVTYAEATLPRGLIDCGPGRYAEVWAR